MAQETKKATIVANGKKVEVYKSSIRGTWIDFSDCKTEYKDNELKF